jgi:hypothetical protein
MSIVIGPASNWVSWRTVRARSQTVACTFGRLSNLVLWRTFAVYLVVAGFAFQGCVTQSHIHISSVSGISGNTADRGALHSIGNASGDIGKQQKRDRYPASDDPSNCPICQQIALDGHFLAAVAISSNPPPTIAFGVFIGSDVLVCPSGVSHAWRGRGPPSV